MSNNEIKVENITFTDVLFNSNDTSINYNIKKTGLNLTLFKYILSQHGNNPQELIKRIGSINSFSINWNGAKLSYMPDKTIYTTADLLSILDSTYNMTYILYNKYNELLEKYKELLNK